MVFKRHSTYRLGIVTSEFQDDKLSVRKPTKPRKTQGVLTLCMLQRGQTHPFTQHVATYNGLLVDLEQLGNPKLAVPTTPTFTPGCHP